MREWVWSPCHLIRHHVSYHLADAIVDLLSQTCIAKALRLTLLVALLTLALLWSAGLALEPHDRGTSVEQQAQLLSGRANV